MRSLLLVLGLATLGGCTTEVTSTGDGRSGEQVTLPEQQKAPSKDPGAGSGGENANSSGGGVTMPPLEQAYLLPMWSREDVQPKSVRFGQSYGLDSYVGKTLVVVLLEGYCPYCQSNSVVAQQLQEQLDSESLDVQIVVLGDLNASQFASRVSLPIFRDHDGKAWDEMRPNASKHDTFVFGPDGKRTYFWLGSYQGDASRWRVEVGAAVREVAKKK